MDTVDMRGREMDAVDMRGRRMVVQTYCPVQSTDETTVRPCVLPRLPPRPLDYANNPYSKVNYRQKVVLVPLRRSYFRSYCTWVGAPDDLV